MDNNYHTNELTDIVQKRRSVYPYQFEKNKIIADEIIWQVLDNANRAPTHKLTQPWRFTVFSGEGLKAFSLLQTENYKKYSGTNFKEKKLKNLSEYPLMSSHVIAIGMKRSIAIQIPEEEEIIAVGCAIENIYLSLTAYGLGGYLSTASIGFMKEDKKIFELEDQDKLIGFFFIGYPSDLAIPLSRRDPVNQKVKWINQ